ncbi:EAL domain-containing protein [Sulfurimonas sp. SAG-AH-194-C21]|nr:EAL domain-containing protein [Sulfurimonas sp. SAG-AH-194-C21]MDF1882372.1 EAL domain-containing protein [Sulfurimonas sp. SAG-AH-194-C21]
MKKGAKREYNRFVAQESIEDYSLRYTPKSFRKFSELLIANTALGSISFLALEAIGASIAFEYGFLTAFWAILAAAVIIFITAIPISYHAAKYNIDIDLITRSAGFGYVGSTITSLIYASFSFIFFALEAAIMAQALELYFGLPLSLGYLFSSLIIVPMVYYGITFINKLQMWTQPIWIVMMIAPFVAVMLKEPQSMDVFVNFSGTLSNSSEFNFLHFGYALGISLALIAQIGEQVDYLRFMPPLTKKNRIKWWSSMLIAGPGWIIIGFLKQMGGIFLAGIVILSGLSIYEAKTPIHMYHTAYEYIFTNPEYALVAATIFVIISQIKINVTNAYAGSLAWSNFFSRVTYAHPGRVIWMVFNISIALLLMEMGVFDVLDKVLGLYSNLAIAWIGAISADLLINKPFGLSPKIIEFKRAHLYNINPVGVGSMGIASVVAILSFIGLFGQYMQSFSSLIALFLAFILSPVIAYITQGKYYIARESSVQSQNAVVECKVCDNMYEREDMSYCPFHRVNICSLCCSLEATCKDMCKNESESNLRAKIVSFMMKLSFERLTYKEALRFFNFLTITLSILFVIGIGFWMVYTSYSSIGDRLYTYELANALFTLFFLITILISVIVWWFLLLKESKLLAENALEEKNDLLQRQNERLELALIGNSDGVWDWTLADNSVYYSPRWKEMLGYADEELVNEFAVWEKLVHPDDIKRTYGVVNDHLEGKTDYVEIVNRMKHKDGSWVWILDRAKALRDEDGKALRLIGTHTNITAEKAKELKALHQEQMIQRIEESIISTDMQGYITSWNHASDTLYEIKEEDALGQHISIIYGDDVGETIKDLIRVGHFTQQREYTTLTGKLVYIDLSLTLLYDEDDIAINIIGYSRDITKEKLANIEILRQKDVLDHQAHHDMLTSLPNRVLFNERITTSLSKASRHKNIVALFYIDLDMFKEVNDSLGHGVGDKLLQEVSKRLKSAVREEDFVARLGGDEFCVIVDDFTQQINASKLAQKILDALVKPYLIEDNKLYISCSIGISTYPQDTCELEELKMYADAAMYKAKEEGRNNFQYYSSDMTLKAMKRVELEVDLREAITNNEFEVYYQAQFNGQEEKLIGMEALVRWRHPLKGLIAPFEFIPLAEETGLIVAIDREVMKMAMRDFSSWQKEKLNPGKLSLNLAVKQLQQKDFVSFLQTTVKEYGIAYDCLELEVTESGIMKNPQSAILLLQELSDLGIELAIDDFGTGYSSLSYLKKLPIDKLKIDKSFVDGLPQNEEDIAIAKAVIVLAKSLNLKIIAEGVETQVQKEFLVQNGCTDIQGYYYSKPIPADEMRDFLLKQT